MIGRSGIPHEPSSSGLSDDQNALSMRHQPGGYGLTQIFDSIAEAYDAWYDQYEGYAIFNAELKCLCFLCADYRGRWLEVGVGSGRFAHKLGIGMGIDPSVPMLRIAKSKGVTVSAGSAAALPFLDHSFDGVILVLTLCFIADSNRALRECTRVLRPEGKLVLGEIPAKSAWGRAYEIKGGKGHPIYASARFYSIPEIVGSAEGMGFVYKGSASTLFWSPDSPPEIEPIVKTGLSPETGFIGLLFKKTEDTAA